MRPIQQFLVEPGNSIRKINDLVWIARLPQWAECRFLHVLSK